MPRTLARGWPLVSRSPFPRQHRAATGRNADLPLRLFGPIGGLCVPSLRKLRKWWFGFFFPAEQKEFLKPGYPRLTAAKRRSAQSKERTPETTERRHRRLEHRRVIRETRGRISPIPTPGRPPREITRTHLSPGTFQGDLPCRSLSPPSRRREPRARPCPGPPRAPAATVPPSSARGRARYAPVRPIARVTSLRFRTRGAWLAPRRVVAEGTIYYVASRVLVVSPRRRIAPTEPSRDVPTYPDDPTSSRARLTTPNAAPRTASNTR